MKARTDGQYRVNTSTPLTKAQIKSSFHSSWLKEWSEEYWQNIKQAKLDDRLIIAGVMPDCQNAEMREVARNRIETNYMGFSQTKLNRIKDRFERWQEIELLLARTDELNDDEKAMIMTNCVVYNPVVVDDRDKVIINGDEKLFRF